MDRGGAHPVWSLLPIYWALKTSLQTEADARSTDTQYLPLRPTLKNYATLLTGDGESPVRSVDPP